MTNRIAATYNGGGVPEGEGNEHVIEFTAPTPGARLILMVSSYNGIDAPLGWQEDHAGTGYNFVYAFSRVADGSETSVTLYGDETTHAVVYERDDCALLRLDVSAASPNSPVSVSGTIPAALGAGRVFLVLNAPNGFPTVTYNQGQVQNHSVAETFSNSYFASGPLPSPGARTWSATASGLTGSQFNAVLVVAYGSTDTVAPSMPPGLHTTEITETAVSIAWSASTDNTAVTGYGLYRDGVKQGGDQTGLTYTFAGLTGGQTYLLEVDARDAAGNRSPRSTISVLAVTDVTAPSEPPNVHVAEVTHTTATLAWDTAADDIALAGYGVYLGGVKQGGDQVGLTFTFTGLGRGATYTVGVDAADTVGHRSALVEVEVTTLTDTLPSAPPALTATAGTESITLAWGAASDDLGIARYEVLLDGELVAATTALGYVIDGLDPATWFEVAVRAVDDGGGRGPEATAEVTTLSAGWMPIASPVYRIGSWVGNARDSYGVDWVVSDEEGWSTSPVVDALGEDSDNADGGFDGPGAYRQRTITLEGIATASSRVEMLAAQERLTGLLSPRDVAVLRVSEAHLTRQARVRLADEVPITDQGMLAFEWTLVVSASDPRRYQSRGIYQEVMLPPLPGEASATITLAGDYLTIPAKLRLYGPIRDFTLTHEESGLVIASKPGQVLTDARYSLEIDLATRVVWAHVPPEVWPEPRPGRGVLRLLPSAFMLRPGPNTITVAGQAVAGQTGLARMVIETADAWT
ncbi:hypothetical protein GCM10022252_75940 [Streptosporangium oxazolinicum]|uniref:Fibronectin type-III domain-containing protein n=1 Tax=Streptosporangium oxazolinicum TaxID=909287 RepID=A0ABP8BM65_9ACTN